MLLNPGELHQLYKNLWSQIKKKKKHITMINLGPGRKKLKWHKQQKSSEFAATYSHSQNI